MAFTLEQFAEFLEENKDEINAQHYRTADLEVNGNSVYYQRVGEFIENNPIHTPGLRRG